MSTDPRKRLEEEIQTLENELREELPRALKTAAALGDLSENADYSAARERQDFVRVRLEPAETARWRISRWSISTRFREIAFRSARTSNCWTSTRTRKSHISW